MSYIKPIFLIVFLLASTIFGDAQTTWSPEVQVKTRAIGGPRVSPDGKRVVYTVNDAVVTADKSEFVTQIWMASADGRENYQITFADKSSTNPKWSPDGNWIAFTSNRKDNRNNLYVLRVTGGEAEQITDLKGSIANFEWSPDGKSIAYTLPDPKSEDEEKNDKGRNDFRWVDENLKMARLYVIPVAKDTGGKREAKKLTNDNRHVTGFGWSPDGARIVFSHVRSPIANDWPSADLATVQVATGSIAQLASTEAAEGNPIFSPDGNWIAASVSELPVRWAQSNRIAVYPANGGTPRVMAVSHDGQPNMIGWTPDGKKVMFTEAKGIGTSLYEADVASGSVREVDHQDAVINGVNMTPIGSGYAVGMVVQRSDAAPEAYALIPGADGGWRLWAAPL